MKPTPTLLLNVQPDSLVVSRRERGWLARTPIEAARTTRPFHDAAELLRTLTPLLKDLKGSARAVNITLADSHCRYLALNRPAGAASVRELDALARSRFQTAFGEDPTEWALAVDRPLRGGSDLLVAVPRALLSAMLEGVRGAGLAAADVVPFWVRCANASGSLKGSAGRWVIASEASAHTVGFFVGARCAGVRRVRRHPAHALHEIISRELPLYEQGHLALHAALWGDAPSVRRDALPSGFTVITPGLPALTPAAEATATPPQPTTVAA